MRLFLLLLLIPCLCFGAPKKPQPTPTSKQDMVCRTKQQDLELRDWITGMMRENDKAREDAKQAIAANDQTTGELLKTKEAATQLANECEADKKCAQAPLSCWIHRLMKHLLWFTIGLIVIVIVVAILAPGVLPIITGFFAFVWKRILALIQRQ